LNELDAMQAIDILSHAGASPRLQTRLNALTAWGELASSAPQAAAKKAVDGLMRAALKPLDSREDQQTLIVAAVDELKRLRPELREYARDTVYFGSLTGSIEGMNAARMALLLANDAGSRDRLAGYARLWLARLASAGRSTIECLPTLLMLTIVVTCAGGVTILGLGTLVGGQPDFGGVIGETLVGAGLLMLIAAVAFAVLSIPSVVLHDSRVRMAEAVATPTACMLAFALATSDGIDFGSVFSLWFALIALRAAGFFCPPANGFWRQTICTLSIAGGVGTAVLVACAAVSVRQNQAALLGDNWLPLLFGLAGGCVGLAWAETRALPSVTVPVAPPNRSLKFFAVLIPVIALAVPTLGYFRLLNADRKADDAWRRLMEARQIIIEDQCPSSEQSSVSKQLKTIDKDKIYRLARCEKSHITLTFEQEIFAPKADKDVYKFDRLLLLDQKGFLLNDRRDGRFGRMGIFSGDLSTVNRRDGDKLRRTSRAWAIPAEQKNSAIYLCVANKGCRWRENLPVRASAAVLLLVVRPGVNLVNMPSESESSQLQLPDQQVLTTVEISWLEPEGRRGAYLSGF